MQRYPRALGGGKRGRSGMGLRGMVFLESRSHPGRGHPTENREEQECTDRKRDRPMWERVSPNRGRKVTKRWARAGRGTHRDTAGQMSAGGRGQSESCR